MSILSAPHFHDEKAAYAFIEARVWPNGPVCPHCGSVERISLMRGKSTRIGTYKCYACRKPFTVKIGTIFEDSHVPMHKWLQAIYLMCASKKGVSSNQLHRTLRITLKSAWFVSHRIREAMREGVLSPLGVSGGFVEADETYFYTKRGQERGRGGMNKRAILTLIERGGTAHSFHVKDVRAKSIIDIVEKNVSREAHFRTDESRVYDGIGWNFASHETVKHSAEEYVRGDAHTNTIEGFFSIFKRGMKGIYQHCGDRHLHRYLAEFDFRYNHRQRLGFNDTDRAEKALLGARGKRLMYRDSRWAS